MYWTRLVLVRPASSLYSASPLKHHPTGKQWCPNPDHYSDSEPARRFPTLLCWALSRAAEPQILTSFVWRGRGSNHQPPACQANAQPLHYPAAVFSSGRKTVLLTLTKNWPNSCRNQPYLCGACQGVFTGSDVSLASESRSDVLGRAVYLNVIATSLVSHIITITKPPLGEHRWVTQSQITRVKRKLSNYSRQKDKTHKTQITWSPSTLRFRAYAQIIQLMGK